MPAGNVGESILHLFCSPFAVTRAPIELTRKFKKTKVRKKEVFFSLDI